ncbi:MAG: CPBP family intramembrane metalloprotease [Sedimentisphaerales bacterium]|nr:CPBP family intramembrane metalloprotease [Sedimentisphaerales bacterium]
MAKKTNKSKATQAKEHGIVGASQLFNFARDSYLERTSRPIYAVWFLLPFIVFYEVGTILINTNVLNRFQIRVVAFVWLRDLLDSIGIGGKFAWAAPPLVVIAILIGLQISSRKYWSFDIRDVLPMAAECIALAVPLIVLGLFLNSPAAPPGQGDAVSGVAVQVQSHFASASVDAAPLLASETNPSSSNRVFLANIVTGIGAGIYEELVFRLILICVLMMLFQNLLGLSSRSSVILSVLISAALFSAHHHIVFLDGRLGRITDFNWTEFSFRTMAGIYFAMLYAIRGFGITAGTHAFYDIIATIVNAIFFHVR